MTVSLPADLTDKVEREIKEGRFSSEDSLIEQALRRYFDEQASAAQRVAALRRIGDLVDAAGLYDRTYVPDQQ